MYSIRTKILTISLVSLALISIAFIFYSMRTTVNYKRLRLEDIRKTVAFEAEKVNKIIAGLEHFAIILALDGLIFRETQLYDINETLVMEYLRSFPAAVGAGFWFEPYTYSNRHRVYIYAFFDKTTGDVRQDDTFSTDEYDYHNKNWYREIINTVTQPYQVIWSKPFVDDSGSYSFMTTAGAGIYHRNGELIGISTVDWEIDAVIEQLTAIKPTKNSFVLLCAPEQDYVISSTRTSSVIGAPINSLPWDINADSFVLGGINYLRFGTNMDNGWLLSIQIPKNEIFAEAESENNSFSVLIALMSIMMLCLAYFLISKLINAPIKQLTSDIAQLALGNLDVCINISSNDELGLLAQTFNKMTFDLKKYIDENARERAEKERISTELSVATEMQASMLPCIFPPFPDRTEFDLYASMLPAKEVGGDFYDFFMINENILAVVIADVSGKGVPAALFMVIAKTLIKNSACSGRSPREVFETVNNMLCENNETNMFVTAFMGYFYIKTGKFVFVNAGHNLPFVKKHEAHYELLEMKPNMVIAFMNDVQYKEEEITLEPGSVLYLYTDGVTEAMNVNMDMFSEQRLLAALNQNKNCHPNELLQKIKKEVDAFADGADQADDITMLALRVNTEIPAENTEKTVQMELKANIENLDKILDFVNAELNLHNCPQILQNDIDIAVEEIFINIANYAYKQPDGTPDNAEGNAAICISINDEKVRIKFEDTGMPYDPFEQDEPDLLIPLEERKIGGLGIFLVKKLMDKVEYMRLENKNVLILTKALQTVR
ncbi:MAG: SpoIIE family protein phosphatase [Treponema sp.]|jgi:sigma-B regulation protein RsbU (phosphoserine phosphatase)|nr:SpoIIE family protein phosphatase [Treponema sp.]